MKKITIFAHGSSKGNPGPAAIGFIAKDENERVIIELSESVGNATTEYANYVSVVRGLQELKEKLGDESKGFEYELRVDDETFKQQLNAEHTVKDISLVGYFMEIYNLRVENFPYLTPILIQKAVNKEASDLASTALD